VPEPEDVVELALTGVDLSDTWVDPPTATVGLVPVMGGARLEIVMSRVDGQFLQEALSGAPPPRPRTHDLLLSVIGALGGEVTAAVLTEQRDVGLFLAAVSVKRPDGSEVDLDARPSDAINIAVRAPSAVLYARRRVLEDLG
jgi:hypothetical protein